METTVKKKLTTLSGREPAGARRVRAIAAATVEPQGERGTPAARREHLVKVVIELHQADVAQGGQGEVSAAARRALAPFAPKAGETDRRACRELSTSRRSANGAMSAVVSAIEGTIVWPGRPSASAMDAVTSSLLKDGYRVVVRERRDCAQSTCATEAMVEWNHPDEHPMGWLDPNVCGRHTTKSCPACQSVFLCTAENAAGQAPAVYCTVCNAVLIEWGASKRWSAELLTRGPGAVSARLRKAARGGGGG
jgi:hypothetical protein